MGNTQVIIYATLWVVSFIVFFYLFEKYEVMYHIFNFFERLFEKKDKSTNRFPLIMINKMPQGGIVKNKAGEKWETFKVIKCRKIYFGKNKGYYKTIVEPISKN